MGTLPRSQDGLSHLADRLTLDRERRLAAGDPGGVVIETERLILRDLASSDWPAVYAILTDDEVMRWMHFRTWEDARRREWFDWCLANDREATRNVYNWGIVDRSTEKLVGWLGIGGPPDHRECGYALRKEESGRGFMTEALRAVIRFEFKTMNSQRVVANHEPDNVASGRVMQKAGMTYLGDQYGPDLEGNWANRSEYAIDRVDRQR